MPALAVQTLGDDLSLEEAIRVVRDLTLQNEELRSKRIRFFDKFVQQKRSKLPLYLL